MLQVILKEVRRNMNIELKRLEEFREELSPDGMEKAGAVLCGAHHLEHALTDPEGPLELLDSSSGALLRVLLPFWGS